MLVLFDYLMKVKGKYAKICKNMQNVHKKEKDMICCKIIADYSNKEASFNKLCTLLGKIGDWIWESGCMYFADTEGDTDEKKIIRIVKKAGYRKVFVDCYDKDNEPQENEYVKGWLSDKVMKIYYNQVEKDNQEEFRRMQKIIQYFDKELDKAIEELKKDLEKTEDS